MEFPSPTGRDRRLFLTNAAIFTFCWQIVYPLIWALCDGSNTISPTGEQIWYGIMDLLMGPCWIGYFLYTHRDVELDGVFPAQRLPTKA